MAKQIFLVRHADYTGGGPNPVLSEYGKQQSLELAQKIKQALIPGNITIWTSSANRAQQTAQIIKQELQLADMSIKEKLWSDNAHRQDFNWLKGELDEFDGEILIIVSHLEYVREFPVRLGFSKNGAGYTEGVKIEDGTCVNFG